MIRIIVFSLAVMLEILSPSVLAEGSAYQIELIVFSQAMPNTEEFEQTVQATQWPSGLTELYAYQKPENTALDDSYAAISKDSRYQPILHVAWIQPLAEEGGLGAPVHIQSADGKLNGYVRMQGDQGLKMLVDLELSADLNDGYGGEAVYRLNEIRPIKLDDVYYLDHPKFGVVAKVSGL
ncbi:MAG: CsiV family protein [Gammaproteobacteria bacterium]